MTLVCDVALRSVRIIKLIGCWLFVLFADVAFRSVRFNIGAAVGLWQYYSLKFNSNAALFALFSMQTAHKTCIASTN